MIMASESVQPYVREGHIFDFVDGLPIRKHARVSPAVAPLPEIEATPVSSTGERAVRKRMTFDTPQSPEDSHGIPPQPPLLKLAQVAKATLQQAAAQESLPAVSEVLHRVSEQCTDAILAATEKQCDAHDLAAVDQAAIERELQKQHRLQRAEAQLQQQEEHLRSLLDGLVELEQSTQTAGERTAADVDASDCPNKHAADAVIQRKAFAHILEYMETLKQKSEAMSRETEVWFHEKISRKLPNTDDPIKAFDMLV
eukprot:jgi/Ulvmu1/2997/UM015_0037.1